MRRTAVILSSQLLALSVLCGGCFAPPAMDLSEADAKRMADQVLELVNLERGERDLHPVVINPALTAVAREYGERMVARGFFGHHDPETNEGPGDRVMAGRYAYIAIGENLAAGQPTAAEVMKAWMESESHAAIIVDPAWREVGIAVVSGGELGIYWVQEFAAPARF